MLDTAMHDAPPPLAPQPPQMPDTPPPVLVGGLTSRQWATFLHLSQLLGFLVPGLGFVGPLVIWLVLKDRFAEIDAHGRMVTNWMISLLIYSLFIVPIALLTCGFGTVLLIPLMVLGILFPVLGGIKASNGEFWKYPMTIAFFRI